MTTKELFLTDLKELLINKYNASCYNADGYNVPGSINNLPNKAITGFEIPIPNEDVCVIISGKDIIDFIYNKK